MLIAVARKPALALGGSGWAVATAVVSSMTTWAVYRRRHPRTRSRPASRRPYSAFRPPSSTAPAAPAIRLPPPATTPISANCEAPEKAIRLSAHAWAMPSPAAIAAAPNASPDRPTAKPTPRPSRTAARTRSGGVMTPTLVSQAEPVLNVPAQPGRVGTRWHADDAFEVPGQMGLIGESDVGGDIGGAQAVAQQGPCAPHPYLVQIGVRRQPRRRTEGAQQRERPRPHGGGQLRQRRRIDQAIVQDVSGDGDGVRTGRSRISRRRLRGIPAQQPGDG